MPACAHSTFVRDPEICPARVDVNEIMKKERTSFRLLLVFTLLIATDPSGEISIRRPIVWNQISCGKSQKGPMDG
jgi:hypothetical protein